ncbi:hypothetical protein LSH36_766g02051 [Paralvinella palmiformis]|uniref:Class II aldolase/adducin N-terminal domain-containing protein n=1 Tax=Paralvinella palmiformis TaxID=53620 RepID=A0AAD9J126_9ANNE|nr:hypothetical protein LSH36_766g02051 [Paralvinella palmiformis]
MITDSIRYLMSTEKSESAQGTARVQFQCHWKGKISSLYGKQEGLEQLIKTLQDFMSEGLWELDQTGAAPVLPDGKIGGNAAAKFVVGDQDYFLVSKSGKLAHQRMVDADFCVVRDFNLQNWSCEYLSSDESIQPTSDTPMHVRVFRASTELNWPEEVKATLHGHALATEEEAKKCGLPISHKETQCSTREDTEALITLMKQYPYPEHKVFIRKNHGFIITSASMADANMIFKSKLKPFIVKSDSNGQ